MNGLNEFLEYFQLSELLAVSDEITVAQFLGLIMVCFLAALFSIVMFRCVMEFIKIITDVRRFK